MGVFSVTFLVTFFDSAVTTVPPSDETLAQAVALIQRLAMEAIEIQSVSILGSIQRFGWCFACLVVVHDDDSNVCLFRWLQ